MQQEDQYLIQMELNRYLQKETVSPGISAEQSFYETETVRTTSSRGMEHIHTHNVSAKPHPLSHAQLD